MMIALTVRSRMNGFFRKFRTVTINIPQTTKTQSVAIVADTMLFRHLNHNFSDIKLPSFSIISYIVSRFVDHVNRRGNAPLAHIEKAIQKILFRQQLSQRFFDKKNTLLLDQPCILGIVEMCFLFG